MLTALILTICACTAVWIIWMLVQLIRDYTDWGR